MTATSAVFTGAAPTAKPRGDVIALTTAPDGGWTQVVEPRAIEHDGILYFGFVDGDDGHIKIGKLEGETATVTTIATSPGPTVVDTHNAPVIYVRPDGRLLIVWAGHDSSSIFRRVTSNVLPDITDWQAASDIDPSLGGTSYTYPSLAEFGSTLYLFYRDRVSGDGRLTFSTSDDDGATWSAQSVLVTPASAQRVYWVVTSDGSRIDIAASTENAASVDPVTIHHLSFDGAWKGADGTALGSPPFAVADLPQVYASDDGPGWPTSIVSDGPTFSYAVKVIGDTSYRRARWDGSAWQHLTVGSAGRSLTDPAPSPTHTDAETLYGPVGTAGSEVLYRWKAGDGWAARPVTVASGAIYPARIHGGTLRKVVWLQGTYTSDIDNNLAVWAGR